MADIRIRGAKAGQKAPRKPNISKDTAASISTAKLLYGLAEGEIYGLADGAKSIRLDGTPLVDDAGNPNFEGVTWDFRNGSNDQEYIKGFPDVSNETPINVELRSSQPWIKAFNDTQISAVRVRFKWNRLSETNGENGDVKGYKIDYAIDLQTDGGAYQTVLTTKIQDKTSAGYERTHRIDLPKAKTGWQLRVRRITPNSTSDLIQDTMMIDAVAEVIDVKLSYPNTALLGVQYNAELFSNIAKMSVRLKGKIIRVPDNYDPVARTYTGIWTGNFKDAYSNNPAWVFYDLCTQWRGGLGERLDATMIDRWSLYALGQYCDQPVSDGQGGLEPRFTCNVYLQKQEEAYTVLQNIAGIFRAMSFWTGERIMLDADVPQDSIYTYSSANIVGGVAGIQYSGTRNRDRHTLAKVAWDNPNNDYQTEYEYVRDEKAMSKFGVKVLDLSAFGCTSQAQAQRAGLWALKTEQLETRQVTFSVGLDGAIPRVGNIISLSDEAFAGRANGGRVSTVNSTQRIIELDREVTASVGDVLIINGGSGKSERRNISNVVGNRITVTAGFTSAEPQHVWAIETADLKLMRFRVMSITENDDATYAITAIQHEPQKYDAIDFGTDVKPTEITIINPDTVDAPASVTVTSRHREVQGQTVATLVISWSQVKGAVAYDVEWRKDDGTWVKVPRTGNVSVEIDGIYSGNYMARVRAISAFDVQSRPTASTLTAIKGKIGLPPTIVGLTATGILFGMDLKWGFAAGSGDAAYTEIQVGSAPNVNVATLTQVSYPTNTHTVTGLQGNLKQSYRARLVDKLGFKSPWSAWVTGTTDASADKIMDLIQGQINEGSLNQILTSKIADIKINKDAISKETQDRIQAIIDANKRITDEAAARVEAVRLLAEGQANIEGNALAIVEAINTERQERIDALVTVGDEIFLEQKARIDSITELGEGFHEEIVKTKDAVSAVDSKIETLVIETGDNLAAVRDEITLKTDENSALSQKISTVLAKTAENEAAVTKETNARTTALEAVAEDINTLTTKTGENEAAVKEESRVRTDENSALSQKIVTLTAETGTNKATIQKESEARTTAIDSVTKDITTLVSKTDDNEAAITKESETRTTAFEALSKDIKVVSSKTDGNTASITALDETLTTEISAQAQTLKFLSSEVSLGYADKTKYADKSRATAWTFAKTLAHADYTNAQMTRGLTADFKDSSARFTENIELLSKQNEATATKTGVLSAQVLGNDYEGGGLGKLNSGLIFEESKARATDVEGLAEQISLLSAGVGEQFDSFEIWHFNKDKDGWVGGTFSGGWIDVKTETLKSPQIKDLDGAVYKHVKLRIKKVGQPTWAGLLTHIGGSKTIKEPNYDEDGVALANWQLDWAGDITSFTLKLASAADAENYYSIDWIAVGRPSPGASNAALLRESKVRATETSANAKDLVRLDSQINGGTGVPIESSITNKLETTANVAKTTAEDVKKLTSTYNEDMYAYEGVVQTTARTLAEATKAEAERLDLLSADVRPRYADASRYVNINRATQWTYWKTIAADNYNSNQRVSELKSEFLDSKANLTSELFTLAQADKAISSSVSQLSAKTDSNESLIQNLQLTITTPSTGLAAQITELQASSSNNADAAAVAKERADQAVRDAQNKSEKARTDAIEAANLYAAAEAKAKADKALEAATGDATTKANAAQSEATRLAALDAKNKADAALEEAKKDTVAKVKVAKDAADAAQKSADAASRAAKAADDKAKTALASLKDISADNKLTPVEKKQLRIITDEIKRDNAEIVANAAKYEVSTATYLTAYNALVNYVDALLEDSNPTSDIVRATFNSRFDNLYLRQAELNAAINTKSKEGINSAAKAAKDAAELAGNKGEVIYSATAPAADKQKAQNLWIDTSGGKNTPKRWASGAWLTVTDKAATDAQKAADAANQKLEPKNLASLVQGSGAFSDEFGSISGQFANFEAVVEGQKTAMEVLSGIGNAEKLKNEIAKARLDKDVTNLNAQSVALTNQINSYTTKIADVTAKRNATSDTALKDEYNKLITDLTAAKDDLTAQKSVIADQVAQLAAEKKVLDDFKEVEDGVRAQHAIKIDNAGKIVGFGLVLQKDGFSAFDVRADRFSISAPSDKPNDVNGNSPFMVLTNPQNINGVQVPAGTYMRNFYAPKGSIDTLQVKDGAIKSAQIDNLAVTSAKIDNLAVTSGKIANLAVDTLQIAGNAVTIPRFIEIGNFPKTTSNNIIEPTGLVFASTTFDAQGGYISIDFFIDEFSLFITQLNATYIRFMIYEGDTLLGSFDTGGLWGRTNNQVYVAQNMTGRKMYYRPPNGLRTYTLRVKEITTLSQNSHFSATGISFLITGVKK